MREDWRIARLGTALALAMALPLGVAAQEHPRHVELWLGLARDSPSLGFLGETPGMNLAMAGIRFSRPLGASAPDASARLTTLHADLIPFALLSPSYRSARGVPDADCSNASLCVFPRTLGPGLFPAGSPVGFGFAPIGLTTQFRRDRRLAPSVGVTGGALFFDQKVPTSRGSRFNFTAAVEFGLRVGRPDRAGLAFTYRFHHISNARTAAENPGVASHLLSVGLRAPRRSAP